MFETAKKYSETTYYRKIDLEQEMEHYLVEPLWHEISQYRSFFRQEFSLLGKKTYLIRNPHVNDLMAQTQERWIQWLLAHQEEPHSKVDLFWLKEEEQLRFSSLLVKLRYDKGMNPTQLFQDCFDLFHLEKEVAYEIRSFLQDPIQNILLKLFLLCMECNKRVATLLYYPTLYIHHSLPISNLCSVENLIDEMDRAIIDLDVTSNFLSLLSLLRLKLSDEMVLLNVRDQTSSLSMDMKTLFEQYPMLQKESIRFYVNHRKLHHYYTLQDYMSFCTVCYETARYSMEKLVELKWYQKQKIGKKFVYFIL